jgi:hypothetical protein
MNIVDTIKYFGSVRVSHNKPPGSSTPRYIAM